MGWSQKTISNDLSKLLQNVSNFYSPLDHRRPGGSTRRDRGGSGWAHRLTIRAGNSLSISSHTALASTLFARFTASSLRARLRCRRRAMPARSALVLANILAHQRHDVFHFFIQVHHRHAVAGVLADISAAIDLAPCIVQFFHEHRRLAPVASL